MEDFTNLNSQREKRKLSTEELDEESFNDESLNIKKPKIAEEEGSNIKTVTDKYQIAYSTEWNLLLKELGLEELVENLSAEISPYLLLMNDKSTIGEYLQTKVGDTEANKIESRLLETKNDPKVMRAARHRITDLLDSIYTALQPLLLLKFPGKWLTLLQIPNHLRADKKLQNGVQEVDLGDLAPEFTSVIFQDICCFVGDTEGNVYDQVVSAIATTAPQPTFYITHVGQEHVDGYHKQRGKKKRHHGFTAPPQWNNPLAPEPLCFNVQGQWTFTRLPGGPVTNAVSTIAYDSLEGEMGSVTTAETNGAPQTRDADGRDWVKARLTIDGQQSAESDVEIDDDGSSFGRTFGNNFDKFESFTQSMFVVSVQCLACAVAVAVTFQLTFKNHAPPAANQSARVISPFIVALENGYNLVATANPAVYNITVQLPSYLRSVKFRYQIIGIPAGNVVAQSPQRDINTTNAAKTVKTTW